MSLTSELRDPGSPVRRWFTERLGHTASVVRAANAQMRAGAREHNGRVISLSLLRTAPEIPAIGDRALVGHAVDWLLRLCLVDEPPPRQSAAANGAALVVAQTHDQAALAVLDQLTERCAALGPARRRLAAAEWLELCRLCLVLAWLERPYRAPCTPAAIVDRVHGAATLDGWVEALVNDLDLADLDRLGRAAIDDHADLRDGRRLVANPTFALSGALGGADGDLVAGTTLLDFKSTATTSIVSGLDIWQIVGYALADADDEFSLTDVGISALRWRRRVTWPLAELLSALAGESLTIARARRELASVAGC